ncbi:UNVERIFIED_CONTAM: hypothetical protein GTU68_051111 [Idotea baltica]|nr:hypothetical protein [Idotea baltica]
MKSVAVLLSVVFLNAILTEGLSPLEKGKSHLPNAKDDIDYRLPTSLNPLSYDVRIQPFIGGGLNFSTWIRRYHF